MDTVEHLPSEESKENEKLSDSDYVEQASSYQRTKRKNKQRKDQLSSEEPKEEAKNETQGQGRY